MRRCLLILCLAGLMARPAAGLEVRVRGERLTLRAKKEPLTEILRQIARAGVHVKIDPRVEASVTADFADEDIQKALDALLEPFGYVLIWDVIEGPLGAMPKLGEVQVFKPGEKKKLEPLSGVSENLDVTTGPSGGAKFVADEVLLGFRPGTRRDDFDLLLSQIGGTVIASIPELGIYQIRLAPGTNIPALIEQLAKNPIVSRAEPNYVTELPDARLGANAGEASGPVTVMDALKGAPALAILDSGLMSVEGLDKAIAGRFDAMNPDRAISDPVGHGTQMALIGSGAVDPAGGAGLTDGVPLLAIRAFDDNGYTSNFGLMRSLAYALQNGAKVANMSWGTETKSDFIEDAIAYAESKGLIVVAAAGNEPTGKPLYPSAYDGVLAVSATDIDGRLWSQSNYGDFVTLSAPGEATFPVGHDGPPGAYAGTSISSAYVSRALALYLAKHPAATPKDAVAALKASLTDAGAKGKDPQYGYGVLDAAALARLLK
jgi:thermitase